MSSDSSSSSYKSFSNREDSMGARIEEEEKEDADQINVDEGEHCSKVDDSDGDGSSIPSEHE